MPRRLSPPDRVIQARRGVDEAHRVEEGGRDGDRRQSSTALGLVVRQLPRDNAMTPLLLLPPLQLPAPCSHSTYDIYPFIYPHRHHATSHSVSHRDTQSDAMFFLTNNIHPFDALVVSKVFAAAAAAVESSLCDDLGNSSRQLR